MIRVIVSSHPVSTWSLWVYVYLCFCLLIQFVLVPGWIMLSFLFFICMMLFCLNLIIFIVNYFSHIRQVEVVWIQRWVTAVFAFDKEGWVVYMFMFFWSEVTFDTLVHLLILSRYLINVRWIWPHAILYIFEIQQIQIFTNFFLYLMNSQLWVNQIGFGFLFLKTTLLLFQFNFYFIHFVVKSIKHLIRVLRILPGLFLLFVVWDYYWWTRPWILIMFIKGRIIDFNLFSLRLYQAICIIKITVLMMCDDGFIILFGRNFDFAFDFIENVWYFLELNWSYLWFLSVFHSLILMPLKVLKIFDFIIHKLIFVCLFISLLRSINLSLNFIL